MFEYSDDHYMIGLIVGWVGILTCLIQCFYLIALIFEVPDITKKMIQEKLVEDGVSVITLKMTVYTFLGTYLSFIIFELIACILLIFGILNKNHFMLLPWLIANAITTSLRITTCLCLLIPWFIGGQRNSGFIAFNLFITGIHLWFWTIILTLYFHFRNSKDEE